MTKCGIYDNPDTNCREIYVHCHLVTYFTEADLGSGFVYLSAIQEQFYNDAKQCGEFKDGTVYGYEEYIPADTLATALHPNDEVRFIGR